MCGGIRDAVPMRTHQSRASSTDDYCASAQSVVQQLQTQGEQQALIPARQIQATELADALQAVAQRVAMDAQLVGTGLWMPVVPAPGKQVWRNWP